MNGQQGFATAGRQVNTSEYKYVYRSLSGTVRAWLGPDVCMQPIITLCCLSTESRDHVMYTDARECMSMAYLVTMLFDLRCHKVDSKAVGLLAG